MATLARASQARPKAKSRLDDKAKDAEETKPPPDVQMGEAQNMTGVKRTSLEAQLDAVETILDPKVMVPYVTKVGELPRRVQVERKKRLYATQNVRDLLVREGLVPDQLDFDNKKLPLYLFDNTDYETRHPHQWVDKVTKVPAIAADTSSGGKCMWKLCIITNFLPESNTYLAQWEDTGHTTWLPRIQVHFLAEDPMLFTKRVKQAHDERAKAELKLKYNLYVTSMPVEEKTFLTPEQLARVTNYTYNTKVIKEKAMDMGVLLTEVNTDYGRVMNKLVFDDSLKSKPTPSNEFVVDMDVSFPQEEKKPVPQNGTAVIPEYDYEEQSSEFYFMSCLTRPEVIIATGKLRFECNKIPKLSLLSTHYTKSLRLDEFEAMEIQTAEQALQHLKESWLTLLRNIIRTSFKDAGKGWFNIKEESLEAYRASKMKRYLTMIKYVMEDALRYLVEETMEKYTIFIEKHCGGPVVDIIDIDDVNCVWPQQDFASMVKKPPLFALEVVTAEGGVFEYNTQIKNFEEVTIRMLEHALKLLQSIPQLEPSIMENQFWSKIPNLSTPQVKEPEIQGVKDRLTAAIKKAMTVGQLYLDKFVEFEPLLKVDVPKYKADLVARKLKLKELLEEVKVHKVEQDSLDRRIPNMISFGTFQVTCKKIRTSLMQKKQQLIDIVMQIISSTPKNLGLDKGKRFEEIERQLKTKTHNPEDVAAQKEFIFTVPGKVIELRQEIEQLDVWYTAMEDLQFPLSDGDFSQQWILLTWPSKIEKLCEKTEKNLYADNDRYQREMEGEQAIFVNTLESLDATVNTFPNYVDMSQVELVAYEARECNDRLHKAENTTRLFNSREMLFGVTPTDYSRLKKISEQFEPFNALWSAADEWKKYYKSWMEESWEKLEPETVDRLVMGWWKGLLKNGREFSKRDLMVQATFCEDIRTQVGEFKPYVPLIMALRQQGMRDRHWDDLSARLNMDLHPTPDFTLSQGIQMGLLNHLLVIEEIADLASKENGIELQLTKMESEWKSQLLQILEYKDTGTYIMKIDESTLQQLDDHIVLSQAMSFSPFKKPFEDRIAKWEGLLLLVSEVIEEWLMVQRQWMYLEPIFSSPDIQTQLPIESKRFQTVNNIWRKALAQAHLTPQILTMCSSKKLLEQFRESNRLLDLVQKGLADYLETKRLAFSRFFFLSNDELLQILSQAKNPLAVQPHLHKCFEAIDSLDFKKDLEIVAMNSAEGEKIPLASTMSPVGNVENWLSQVEAKMKESIHQQIKLSLAAYKVDPRTKWVQEWPGQVVLAGSSVYWTAGVEGAIRQASLQQFFDNVQVKQLEGLTDLVRAPLSKLARMTLGALIVIDVHARDVVQALINEKIKAPTDFEWVSQLRYYWENEGIWVKMVQASISYGYEYLGNTPRLVITPLTDRCYMTLMGALHLNLGGAPAGPAGTGKTETTKDLAKALAKQCVVFNCSDGLDYLAMGKFFKGLASSGAWACFDEFNRIDLEVLSVIAQQILTIQLAIQQKVKRFIFEDTEISLDPSCSVYITMNPGYAGRSELPDNLKALFRPCAMMVPDYALIGEISLFSFGFRKAKALARKMVATFKLCSEQLSSQDHYDYGMRAVKSVIVAAGNLKRSYPDEDEDVLLLRGLNEINVPKFLSQDIPLFAGIISDLFPGVIPPEISYTDLLGALAKVCKDLNVQPVEAFTTKVIQLYETTVVRHGLMLVGPTGGGKTANYRSLAQGMSLLSVQGSTKYDKVRIAVLNPKSITMGQLYGDFDENTHEWTDGVLACYMRELVEDTAPSKKWIMFDGPVDAIWIENMNTVLDDNKKLCLVSGEIIQMSPTMTMMFEVEDLAVASPATVSRCGMVFMEPSARGFDPLLTSWLQRIPKHVSVFEEKFTKWFRNISVGATRLVRKFLKQTVNTSDDNLIISLFNVMDAMLVSYCKDGGVQVLSDEELARLPQIIEPLFMFATIWSSGASCDNESRVKFDTFMRDTMYENQIEKAPPFEGDVFQYTFNHVSMTWSTWMATIPQYICDPKTPFSELIVPTASSVGYKGVLHSLLMIAKHVLCVGNTGTGKTLVVRDKLLNHMESAYVPVFINFSARTGANQTQDLIDSKTEKRRKGVFGPPSMKKYVIFVDDVNMPQREKYFAQPPIEILRQWMDHKGWYDRHPPCAFRTLVDIQFVGCMGPPGGGRNPVTMRFLRHFNFLSFTEMPDDSLNLIFTTILSATFALGFPDPVKAAVEPLVSGTVEIYNTIRKELLPTPAKSHYTFNLRDLSKVIQGVLRADTKTTTDVKQVIKLWIHEAMRVFQDRLINDEDRAWFRGCLKIQLDKYFQITWESLFKLERIILGDFIHPQSDVKIYEEVTDIPGLQKTMYEYLESYNSMSNAPMNLVLFLDAIEHVSRICRVIRLPLGNALLLGVGGSGRQSLSRLATFIEEFELIQVEIAKGYGNNEWKDDLKRVLFKAGLEDKETVFLFSDTQIIMESFLEDINNILNSGEVPNLWKNEDYDAIANAMRPLLLAAGTPVTKLTLQTEFLKQVRKNLHVILAMSPIGDTFRTRLRMFPSLVNCCTIDWFSEWPEEALKSVARNFLTATGVLSTDEVGKIVTVCVHIHQSVEKRSKDFLQELSRHNYVTPTSYLELLNLFIKQMGEKTAELKELKGRLEAGLDKLLTTAEEVTVMQAELTALTPVVKAAAKEADEMMAVISSDKKAADVTKQEVGKQEAEANKMAAKAKEIADSAQVELDKALPALEAALTSLKLLTRNDIVEVKSLKNPPEGVKMVMEACCIMFQQTPKMIPDPAKFGKKIADYWEASGKLLTDPTKFLDSLLQFDKDNIPDAVIAKIEPFLAMESFTPEQVSRVSKACTSICMWVRAMHSYYLVCKVVAPKRAMLAEAQAVLDSVLKQLHDAQQKLIEVEAKIVVLEADLTAAIAKKDALAKQAADCERKLANAEKLIGGLGGERTRWIANIASLEIDIKNVVGDVCVAAGAIAYTGPFTPSYRAGFNKDWVRLVAELKLPHTSGVTLQSCLKDPVKMRAWNIAGLPSDSLSEDNGIIVNKARRWPLMIDPQGQANKWIKNMYKDIGLDVIKLSEKDYLRTLENGVRFGRVVLLENVLEQLDPALEPLLLQQTYKQGGQEVIKIGENIIPYHKNFKFFITTKLRNPHYAPEVSVKVTLLNFFVTPEGLEDQLLGNVVTKERPDLAEMKTQLTLSNASMKRELKELEAKILYLLSNAEGNILDDEELINTLAQSKITSDEIKVKVQEAEKTEVEIDKTREVYRKVATRASLLFFCISDLASVDPMYQYSLAWFISLFVRAMDNAAQSTVIEKRLENLIEYFTYSLYVNVCRSLFEKHKLMFSLMLCIKILQGIGEVHSNEWRFLLAGGVGGSITTPNPAPDWLTDKSWSDILNLSKLPRFEGFEKHVVSNIAHYKKVFDSSEAHRMPLAGEWDQNLDRLQKLLVLRCLRIDKSLLGIQDFVTHYNGQRFIEPPAFDLAICFKDGTPNSPLIFVLSPGADPMADLLKLAEDYRFTKKFEKVSLGQGQGPKAEKLLTQGMERGMWVCLQNCHLSQSWMPALDRIVDMIDLDKVHKDFRLWLTSMPSPDFPVAILQNGVKMTLEPPKGLRSNMVRSYLRYTDKQLNDCSKPEEWKKLVFASSLFHAVIQERRKFGPLGWNIRYDFTDGDLWMCQTQVRMFLNEYEEIPFKVIRFLMGEINYGGRVTDDKDRRLINTLLHTFIRPEVCTQKKYSFSESGIFHLPDAGNVNAFLSYCREIPLAPKPEIFGLHENADITCDQNESNDLYATVLALQPRERAAGAGLSREEVIEQRCREMLSQCPPLYDLELILQGYPTMYNESMNTVLTQECIRYNGLLAVMRQSMQDALKALKGLVVMSPDLEMLCNSIFLNLIPDMWASKAYPSLKPLALWIEDLLERCSFISGWIGGGAPAVFWISGFFFPQAFLTGTLQNFARKQQMPIDTVSFEFHAMDEHTEKTLTAPPQDGCYVRGLYFEGARWDFQKHQLTESRAKELFTECPIMWLKPMQHREPPSSGIYNCPVYKTLLRAGTLSTTGHSTNFVMYMEVKTDKVPAWWINRGVALFTALAY
ncbi:unnamed protein product [Calypogeia fissa]